ncbi:hypothetical protein V1478_005847 [Vespula squamosa]|uniref:Uncharacterized protein n=1 Tax=Vespula squamosa TaxID=30214 RepID=A0ABD2BA17_VESSQ
MDQRWIEFAYGVESRSRAESRLMTLFAIGSSRSERVALGRSPFRVFSWFERTKKETYRFVERRWKIQRKRKIKNEEEEEKEEGKEKGDAKESN